MMQQPAAPTSHSASGSSGASIISMLEVIQSDFGKGLAEATTAEDASQSEYDKLMSKLKIDTATMTQDVEYKSKEATALDKTVAELKSDRDSGSTELDAVLESSQSIRAQCVAKP